ncbi:hypothetical protein L810_1155 [Burkholderia sp. AU4i]|uniref:hypothetical protein n=1 Tax=Burkholderia sp. AU4i TaxID=1335308 RepID=UPI0003988B6C|nr:hypothetical protein [Burkholderia sp. AU4i]ERJ35898.1 hypothetical protein L810_1155 [Burkholderia sp. AU4i]
MKMARASKADLDAALDVSNIIEQLEQGYMPSTDESDDLERFDSDDREQCKRALAAILDAAEKGSLFRVTFGMTVVLDPRNELLDPAADTLELHPKLVAALDGAAVIPAGFALVPATPTPEWVLRYCEFTNRDPAGTQHASSMDGWVESSFAQVAERELALAIQSAPPPERHPDDLAVDRFAATMKAKLAEKRAAGRGGWDDPKQCHVSTLARMLVEHVAKGDPVDVGNFAMMLHQRAAGPLVLPAALHVYTHPEPLKGGK